MVKVIVDADACPSKDIIFRVSRECGARVVLVSSLAHVMTAPPDVEIRQTDSTPQAVDLVVANMARPGDVVVTQDWGLAAVCLGRGAAALAPTGQIYDPDNMGFMLEIRHDLARFRRGGGRQKGPRPRTTEDDIRLEAGLRRLLGGSAGAGPSVN